MLLIPAALQAEEVQFIDVRESAEYEIARLPGFALLSLSQASVWGGDISTLLNPDKETVVLCHHGVRSMQAASVSDAVYAARLPVVYMR